MVTTNFTFSAWVVADMLVGGWVYHSIWRGVMLGLHMHVG
jgi:hypothetical protein